MGDYLVFDIETTFGKTNGRIGNRWDESYGLCSVGWLRGNGTYTSDYVVHEVNGVREGLNPMHHRLPMPDLTDVSYLVGHNIKYDLLFYWDHPELIKFLERGGKVFCTMYAEYLLSGQLYNQSAPHEEYRINLKQCGIRRGLTYAKQDVVKALWDSGIRTEDIKEAVLMEYMEYDIRTTDELFKAQVKQAREQNQVRMIMNSMDGLLASTEMEFNGMKIDKELALKQAAELEQSLEDLRLKLDTHVPELPIGCTFSWGSWRNLSALLFGGEIPYVGREYVLDEDGNKVYYQKKVSKPVLDEDGNVVRFKSGKRVGELKTKIVTVPDIERGPKERNCIKTVVLPQMVKPSSRWAASESYPDGTPKYYSVSKTVIDSLKSKKVALVDDLLEFRKIDKDLGTYYIRTKIVKGNEVHTGMLTNIQPTDGCVHGTLNHCITITRRLSGSEPNLQNISAKGNIKSTFVSRFNGGVVAEIDYSQLEVVTQGVNSMDANLLKALADGVCFHCEWASFVTGESYENVFQWAKIDEDPVWVKHRQNAKPLGFGGFCRSKSSLIQGNCQCDTILSEAITEVQQLIESPIYL